jgi:hypothetical protein
MVELATQYGRYGYRRVTKLLHRRGWRVNHKRIERLWRQEGLKVSQKQPKRRRLWFNNGSGHDHPQALIRRATTGLGSARPNEIIRSVLVVDLRPLAPPALSRDFEQMGRLEQTLHALEYQVRVLEFRMAANGWLRAWILSSLKILMFVLVPVVAFLIALSFLVPAAAGTSSFLHYTELATQSAFWTVVYGILTMVGLAFGVGLLGILIRLRRG